MSQTRIPAWITVGVLPTVNILMAFAVSAILFRSEERRVGKECRL